MPVSPTPTRLSLALRYGISCLSAVTLFASAAHAGEAGDDEASFEFNELFLHNRGGGGADLRVFERGSTIAPGSYGVDVYLNLSLVKRHDLVFKADDRGRVAPIIPRSLLRDIGVNLARLEADGLIDADQDDAAPVDLSRIPSARAEFDTNNLALMVSVPHIYVLQQRRGYVDPSRWDTGETVLFTNYQANFSHDRQNGYNSQYRWLSLRSGLNIGGWRLRNDSSLSSTGGQHTRFRSNRTYVEHDVRRLNATLSLGELYTPGEIFDSVRFRGAQMTSDLGMLSGDRQGYAPVVRGIAETNATVEIRQNGGLVYSTSVAPGAFELRDLYAGGSNGDLHVKIIEADGRVREFTQPYSYLPVMTRPGSLRFSLSSGEYELDGRPSPRFSQGTLVYGLANNLTGFGGVLAADNYRAFNAGLGINSTLGGFSLDFTQSRSRLPDRRANQGYSARLLYAKTLTATSTVLTMAAYRYSTEGYRSFSQHVDDLVPGSQNGRGNRQRSRVDISINQTMPGSSSLYLTLGETSYWNLPGRSRNWRFGYNGNISKLNYNLALSRDRDPSLRRSDTQISANFSVPLGSAARSHRLYTNLMSSRRGADQIQAGLSGYLNDSGSASYALHASHYEGQGTSAGASATWETPLAQLSGNYQYGPGSRHVDVGASGSLVLHRNGITFGQPVGETFGLLEVPKTRGVGVEGWNGVRTDRRGYAIVPYLQPYRMNWLNVDTRRLGSDVEILGDAPLVVPTRGAMVRARYGAETGRRVQFVLKQANGQPVPFGAMAYGAEDKVLGMVDNLSRVLAFGVQEHGRVDVRWNGGACVADYQLPAQDKQLAYERVALSCVAPAVMGE